MTAPTFTPGPWRRSGLRSIAAGTGLDTVTLCEVFSGGVGIYQADANEALIAAAPELYEVARSAEAMLTRQKWVPDPSSPEGALLLNVRALLARLVRGAQ